MTTHRWRYSASRLLELDARLIDLDRASEALNISGPRANGPRFKNAADRDAYRDLVAEMFRVTDERDRCAATLWRRRRKRAALAGTTSLAVADIPQIVDAVHEASGRDIS
jgi:hypothetical protein